MLILILAFSGSFLFLYLGMRQLPMGVSYAVWTGIGTAGGAILGMLLGESKTHAGYFLFFNHCFCDWFKINWLESERTLFGLLKDR